MAGMQAVQNKATMMGGAMGKAGQLAKKGLLVLGAAAIGTGVGAAKMAMDFEKSMAQIEALVGVPKDEMALLEQAALDMGKQFGVSAAEASGGLFFLKSAGLSTADAIETLSGTAMASAVGLGTMEDLANTATTAMTNFGLDATTAFDSIAKAAELAKADPSELGRIMNRNSASAALVGMSYDDMSAALAGLTVKFGDSRMAGTGMAAILRKLVKPSEMAKDKLAEIGVGAEQFKEMMAADMPAALATLNEAFAESGQSQTEWMGKVFEDGEAITAAAAIINDESGDIIRIYEGMTEKGGKLAEGWDIMAQTAAVRFDMIKEGAKSGLIPIGTAIIDVVLPAIEKFIGGLSTLRDYFGFALESGDTLNDFLVDLPSSWQGITKTLADMALYLRDVAFPAIGSAVGMLRDYFSDVLTDSEEVDKSLRKLPEAVQPFVSAMGSIASATKDTFGAIGDAISDAIDWFNALDPEAQTSVTNFALVAAALVPATIVFMKFVGILKAVGAAIAAISMSPWMLALAALIGLIALVAADWEEVLDFLTTGWEQFSESFAGVMESIKSTWDTVWATIGPVVQDVVAWVMEMINGLAEWWGEIWPMFSKVIETVLTFINEVWRKVWNAIDDHIRPLWNGIMTFIGGVIDIIKGIIKTGLAILTGDWSTAWEGIKDILLGIWDVIKGIVEAAFHAVASIFALAFGELGEAWGTFWDTLKDIVTGIWDGIVGIVKWGLNQVIEFIQSLINTAIAGLNAVIALANKVPGINITPIKSVNWAGLAAGGDVLKSGMTIVGENGPEAAWLPRGAQVQPLSGTGSMMSGPQTIIVQIGDEEFGSFVLDRTGLADMRTARRQR